MTVTPELKGLDGFGWADGQHVDDLATWAPGNPDEFFVQLVVHIGPTDEEGEELFEVYVCSPRHAHGIRPGDWPRQPVVIPQWDLGMLERKLTEICTKAEASTWQDAAERLGEYARWEFEDFRG